MNRPFLFFLATLYFVAGGGFAVGEQEFDPRRVVQEFPPIVTPKTVGIAEADKWVKDNELVIGVVIGDQARAYPINMLTGPAREIINDKLGDRSIAATW